MLIYEHYLSTYVFQTGFRRFLFEQLTSRKQNGGEMCESGCYGNEELIVAFVEDEFDCNFTMGLLFWEFGGKNVRFFAPWKGVGILKFFKYVFTNVGAKDWIIVDENFWFWLVKISYCSTTSIIFFKMHFGIEFDTNRFLVFRWIRILETISTNLRGRVFKCF